MICAKCSKDLTHCDCPDKEERLQSLLISPYLTIRMCKTCGKHYALCQCEFPVWKMSNGGDEYLQAV